MASHAIIDEYGTVITKGEAPIAHLQPGWRISYRGTVCNTGLKGYHAHYPGRDVEGWIEPLVGDSLTILVVGNDPARVYELVNALRAFVGEQNIETAFSRLPDLDSFLKRVSYLFNYLIHGNK